MKKWVPVLGALILALAACSTQPAADDTPASSASTSSPSSAESPSASVTPADEPSDTETPEPAAGRVIASEKASSIGPIALSGDTLAYPFEDASDSWNAVRMSKRGVAETVARSDWKKGLINSVALSGHWLAYVDQDHTQGNGLMEVFWRVWAVDLRDNSRVLVASNGDTPDRFVPFVDAGGGYFLWSQGNEAGSPRQFVWQPGLDKPRVVVRTTTWAGASYSRGGILYLGLKDKGHINATWGGDCWRVDMDGGPPIALTHTGLARGCAASDDTLIWTQLLPEGDPRRADVGDAPFTTWTLDLDDPDAVPTQIYQGSQSGLFPVAGDEFVAWATAGRSYLMRSTASGKTTTVRGGMSMAASGSHLAVADFKRGVAEVTLYDAP